MNEIMTLPVNESASRQYKFVQFHSFGVSFFKILKKRRKKKDELMAVHNLNVIQTLIKCQIFRIFQFKEF